MMFLATAPSNKSFTLSRSKPMPDLKDYMTTEEAAKALGFHVISVRRLVHEGKLDHIKFGKALMISRKAVEKYKKDTAGMEKNDPRRKPKIDESFGNLPKLSGDNETLNTKGKAK